MGWLQVARIAGFALVGAALASIVWLAFDRFDQKARADRADRCEVAALTATEKTDDCGPNVVARVEADRATIICEAALLPELRAETRFTARQACGPGVLRLIAEGDGMASQIAGLDAQLAKLRADSADAVARAEARGRADQTRRDNAQQLIQAAPRSADGRITCDADCLRKLAN